MAQLETSQNPISHGDMMAAFEARDPAYDGQFIIAVKTTGIYCRPVCPARMPKRENITFFSSIARAKSAGYRACKRCYPDQPREDISAYIKAARMLRESGNEAMPLGQLADQAGLSPAHFQRRFKRLFGLSPKGFHAACRAGNLKKALQAGDDITGAIFEAGYGSTSRVYEKSDQIFAMTPKAYRAGGKGETISYAQRRCSLGILQTAATDKGICSVMIGDDGAQLLAVLREEFAQAELLASAQSASAHMDAWMDAIETYLAGEGPCPHLPLDLRGTAFQMSVWAFLQSIPDGALLTYSQLASQLGRPKAVRAAASACARNRVALLVPCHRILRADGNLGGYRWGLERKAQLIALERGYADRAAAVS